VLLLALLLLLLLLLLLQLALLLLLLLLLLSSAALFLLSRTRFCAFSVRRAACPSEPHHSMDQADPLAMVQFGSIL
jgi:hypothetical protein